MIAWTAGTAADLAAYWAEQEAFEARGIGRHGSAAQRRAAWEGLSTGQLESERAAAWQSNDRERYWLAATYRAQLPAIPV